MGIADRRLMFYHANVYVLVYWHSPCLLSPHNGGKWDVLLHALRAPHQYVDASSITIINSVNYPNFLKFDLCIFVLMTLKICAKDTIKL